MLRQAATIAFLVLSNLLMGQGLLRSTLVLFTDTSVVCTLSVQNFERYDRAIHHYFKQSITTYLLPGDYLVSYAVDSTNLHREWIHISTKFTVLHKKIPLEPIPLHKIRFVRPKRKADWEPGVFYWD